jgi:hypothetical protein
MAVYKPKSRTHTTRGTLQCAGILYFRQEQLFSAAKEDVDLTDRDKVSVKLKTRQNTQLTSK